MSKIHQIAVLALSLLLLSTSSDATKYKKSPGSATAYEVRFLSVDLGANGLGTVVARPCDESVGCELLYARIDSKTQLSQNDKALTRREAKRLEWHSGVIAINRVGAAVSIKLFGGRP